MRAKELLDYFVENYNRIPLGSLLNEIIEKTNYLETFSLNPSKNSIIQNIKNFTQFVNKISNRGLSTFNDLIAELDKAFTDKVVSDNTIETDENAINLLTIHKSKGLEFPIVILYNLNSKDKNGNTFYFEEQLGFNFKFMENIEYNGLKEIKLPMYLINKSKDDKKDDEENKRLLYVATTRAKDILTISSTLKRSIPKKEGEKVLNKPTGLFKVLAKGLEIDNNDLYEIINKDYISQYSDVSTYINDEYGNIHFKYQIPILKRIDEVKSTPIIQSTDSTYFFMMEEVKANPPVFQNSATKIQQLLKNPMEFTERYILSLPEFLQIETFFGKGEISGDDRGTLIHKAMSELNQWTNLAGDNDLNRLEQIIRSEIENLEIKISDDLIQGIRNEILSVLQNSFIQKHLNELLNAEVEVELNMPYGNDFIKVIIDALVPVRENEYEIWDWKSNYINSAAKFEELTEQYKLQMKYYAFVVSYLYPELSIYRAKLFFTRQAKSAKSETDWISTFEWTKNELNEFAAEIASYFEKMHNPAEMYKILLDNL
jgi:ATP-dependent exoDNAse (exonuclease V) beta subunit